MPTPARDLTLRRARDLVAEASLAPPDHDGGCGLELEVFPSQTHDEVLKALAPVAWPGGSRLTFEPGGQVELSGPCLPSTDAACAAMRADLAALAGAGIETTAIGMHPVGGRPRVVDAPRYDAMEAFFNQAGRTMMRDTAAFQVNVDLGDDRRWRLVHALGPVLAAAFANSPYERGRLTGLKSNRSWTWLAIDASRTCPAGGATAGAWVDYALAAQVMLIRTSESGYTAVEQHMTLADWVEVGHPLGFPTADDVVYHLTTLFPPVRPRRWLELRFIDSLPSPWWEAAAHAVDALLGDAADVAEEACRGTECLWPEAARMGVEHPVLGAAAEACLSAVPEAGEFVERFTARRRCPADEAA